MFEPVIAARAASSATAADIDFITKCVAKTDEAHNWENYELWDRTLHRAIAAATQNAVCVTFIDIVNKTREADDWSRTQLPPISADTPSRGRALHFEILSAIAKRNPLEAARSMRMHLERVREVYFNESVIVEKLMRD